MIVGLSNTKSIKTFNRIKAGLENQKIKVIHIKEDNISEVKKCSFMCVVCYNLYINNRKLFINAAKKNNKPVVYIERGVLGPANRKFCINKPKRIGVFYADKYRDDFTRSGIYKLSDWKDGGEYHSILVHNPIGYKSNFLDIDKQLDMVKQTQEYLHKKGLRTVTSWHPRYTINKRENIPIDEIIQKSIACIGWHTNALCDAVISGVPIYCLDEDCFAYEIASHNLDEEILKIDRTQWLNKMSWSEWTQEEILNGTQWPVLIEAIKNT